jgi:phosphoribosylanthranilate isomerase
MHELLQVAGELGLDTLVEAHDADELARATTLGAPVIGLNARDLGTFEIDRRGQLELVASAPQDRVVVAESGILNRAHGAAAELAGADAVLVGSALMRADDPAAKLGDLLRRPCVKVCGLTRDEDVAVAAEAGADLAGFVLAESPRRAAAPLPVPDTMLSVGVFVGETEDAGTDLAQLYAQENGHRARDGVLLRGAEVVAQVKDLPWLEEDDGHWERAARTEGRVLLAGGLGPENVRAAIEAVDPWCVDASRSLEASPGIKDHDRVRAFVEAAR